ncbi:MAG: ATP-binding protein [Caulobacter sp.]|nr:ATP-binding protein [Caulobacter sp.]
MADRPLTELRILRWRDEGRRARLNQLLIVAVLIWLSGQSPLVFPWAVLCAAAIWVDGHVARRLSEDLNNAGLRRLAAVTRVTSGSLFSLSAPLIMLQGTVMGLAGALLLAGANTVSNALRNRGSISASLMMLTPSISMLMLIPWLALRLGVIGSVTEALLLAGGGFLYAIFVVQIVKSLAQEARQYEAAVQEARAAAAARDVFLANMSHEIRTPLNGLVGVAQALAQTPLTPAQQDMVALISGSGRVLERLLSDVLDTAKIEAGGFTLEDVRFELRSEIEAAAHLMRERAAEKGLMFQVHFSSAAEGTFVGDAVRLRQIVANLASNAVKFTEAGSVQLIVDVQGDGPDSRLIISVEDDGIGFDSQAAERLFQPFSQADSSITRRFGGTGLGLSISRSLAEAMGGALTASSIPGVGSKFLLKLPIQRVAPAKVAGPMESRNQTLQSSLPGISQLETTDSGPEQRPLRVLLAEDHPTNQKVVRLFLEPHGMEVVTAENGQMAVEFWRTGRFDVILMDMQMPVMDGVTAVRLIREAEASTGRARTPIAMLTANAMAEHRTTALAVGADIHITKPISPTVLLEGLMSILADDQADERVHLSQA